MTGRIEGVEWRVLEGLSPYAETLAAMEARVAAIAAGTAPEAVWLLEHPPLYTAGTSAKPADLVEPDRFPVHVAGRGGERERHGVLLIENLRRYIAGEKLLNVVDPAKGY